MLSLAGLLNIRNLLGRILTQHPRAPIRRSSKSHFVLDAHAHSVKVLGKGVVEGDVDAWFDGYDVAFD